ncbi:hypothetical protein PUNSTDRAFT_115014 [Punctularia strigosozonata HHB-11173 SS5]|uniref:uncharacterized protein n=1 Tax=Punctularia strigosozonata (strain HHB-11173) TaxID=741275 RepID=UPI0004417C0E|nr:uncharacterized protein PUNSTDRAFT_115014 [Punctularia strigosozonata HHB-11173 SS5]EIN06439.1 hypothetical protein PUNSTDRAFT_115014 [Punctularia strigosozonata HHB-11173 SS5]
MRRRDSRSRSRDRKQSRRSRSRSRSRDKAKRRRDRSRSVSSSDSDSSREQRRKRRKEKQKRRSSRSRERKERKKAKKEKKKKEKNVMQWGKYGLIHETDMYSKDAEFRAWLVEERMINPETISKDNMKKEFARFAEDYNTATLPNEKYYDMARYEVRMAALRAGEFVPQGDGDTYDPMADVRALETERRRKTKGDADRESYLNKEQLQELRKVQQERVQAGKMKILGMDIKQNMGVRMDGTMFDG